MSDATREVPELNLVITRGNTWGRTLHWPQPVKAFRPIANAIAGAPLKLEIPGHGMPDGWFFRAAGAKGMPQLNHAEFRARVLGADLIEVNEINAAGWGKYEGGGIAEYWLPPGWAGYAARLRMRSSWTSTEILFELTTANGRIILDNVLKTIELQLSEVETAGLGFDAAVYDLDVIAPPAGKVYGVCSGQITVRER